MSSEHGSVPRVVVATVALGRASSKDDVAKLVMDELFAANFSFVRSVTVNREPEFIKMLVSDVATDNEADAIILVGGTGLGPRDFTCEVIDAIVERRMEGFGEAYRRLLREEMHIGPSALLARATAGVYNKCVVLALPRKPAELRLAMHALVVPTLREAVLHAAGRPLRFDPVPPGP
jgi:molybdenum cofactor biosynthesis protein B